ncbi:Fe-S oxidoreductase [Desulfitispora alkaliphila]|uniref:4Fe-4S dicluster domain-containing protein n=1 Tax=Desulfitispora alkaliphila TaxID=622674 RepID=UPI003D1A8D6A
MSKRAEVLQYVDEEIAKCMKCGNCMAACPIYKETLLESNSARGKIQLARAVLKGDLDLNKSLQNKFGYCLTCKACNAICPCGVKPDEIILATRAALAEDVGLHPLKKSIFNVVSSPKLFDFGMKTGAIFKGLALKKQTERGYSPRFPVGLDTKRVFPPLAKKTFRDSISEVNKPVGGGSK